MRLVDDDQEVAGEVVEQRERRGALCAAVEDPRVVLDAVAVAELAHHLHVVLGALAQAVGLEHLARRLELGESLAQLAGDLLDRTLDRRRRRHVVRRRVDDELVGHPVDLAGQRIEVRDRLDLVAEQRHAIGGLAVRRLHLDDVAASPEARAIEQHVVAAVLDVDEAAEDLLARVLLPHAQADELLLVLGRRAETVDARDGGDDHDIAAGQERRRRGVPQPVDVVVDRRVLLDVRVRGREVRLGLVVVVVRDEVLDRVLGEELAELVAQLRCEGLVVRDHERRALEARDHVRDGERLAGAGRPEERREAISSLDARYELIDRLGLIACGEVVAGKSEFGHTCSLQIVRTGVPF